MTSFNIKIKSGAKNDERIRKLGTITEDLRRGIRAAFYRQGKKTIADINTDILRKPRTGRVYIINGRRHVASVPGEAPANITGKLRKALDFNVQGYSNSVIGYDDTVDYGLWLEIGTAHMDPRPGLKIGIDKNENDGTYEKIFDQEIRKTFTRKGR